MVMDCKQMPPITIVYCAVTVLMYICIMISCLIKHDIMYCFYFQYFPLVPQKIYEEGEVWRLITCYFVPNSLWNTIFLTIYVVIFSFKFEKIVGTKHYACLFFGSMIANSLIANAISAFFGKIPGIKDVAWFGDFWTHNASTGQTAVEIFLTIYMFRVLKLRETMCCFFKMPVWLFYIILIAFCQLMMYPIQYGLEYNVAALIVGFACPMKIICPESVKRRLIQFEELKQHIEVEQTYQPQTMNDGSQPYQVYQPVQPKSYGKFSGGGQKL